ncbi:amidohydrolase family protein [Lentzea sp. BCCO 10_0061]|uniref:Amidohydrolase family protein n=1 Tax=Lentzea sokolovensis TaxID=3095429 RepID=A0ABU4UVE1_9PSEU|nr:amidohydrolase family protein [Lentzea sp. BCCO 10_0061]MDX8143235.1 amidohydrolase family protein [Lentzea sp. BCCO 10_0061]
MDAAGIDVQVLSHTVPGAERLVGTGAIQRATEANDALASIVAAHPHRFAGFAALPMREPEAAAVELRRAVDELGFKGALVNGLVDGRFLDDLRFRPVLRQAEQLGAPMYPAAPPAAVAGVHFGGLPQTTADHLATAAWGLHSETALHVLRLIVAGIFDEFPALQVVIGHMGEMIPFALARIDTALTPISTELRQPVADYFRTNIWITTSGYTTFPPPQCALAVLGTDRIIFSVDYPYTLNEPARVLLDNAPINQEDREQIARGNVERLLRL